MDVCSAFAWGDVGFRLNPYPAHYRPAFASSILPFPHAHRRPLRSAFPCRGTYGVSTFHLIDEYEWVRLCLFACRADVRVSPEYIEITDDLPFWPGPLSVFGPFEIKTFIGSSHSLAIPLQPGSPTA